MDGSAFDRLVRRFGEDDSRRGLLRSALAVLGGGLGLTSLLGLQTVEAGKCEKKCKKKAKKKDWSKKRKQRCLNKCKQNNGGGQKKSGQLCDNSGECASPFICAKPTNAGNSDKKCCSASGAPCGGDDGNNDDLPPLCCQGFVCSTDGQGTSTPGTCQPAP